ncbi:MAG: hypothetical protein E7Z75_00220 [Methanobrevibacter olleyae]|uniref:AP2 domain-containing protein n=1 Tax=Methanobrevibacter olleyae TaxID=294671 RepID=A0A8T3VKA0_METOL|nr:hypothetical protein [Methanobrevibacter olleyae]
MVKGERTKLTTLDDYFSNQSKKEKPIFDEEDEYFSLEEIFSDEEDDEELIKESESIDLKKYSDYVNILFNAKMDKWMLELFNKKKLIVTRYFKKKEDAENQALRYLKELDVLDRIYEKKNFVEEPIRSRHKGIFFSQNKGKWGARVKGYKGSRLLGYFNTEEEAYLAKRKYLNDKEKSIEEFIHQKRGLKHKPKLDTSGEGIHFSKQSGLWIVSLKDNNGKYVNLGKFKSEEEAIKAKNDFLNNL